MENEELNEVYDLKVDLEDPKTVFDVAKEEYNSLVEYLSNKIFVSRKEFEHVCENTEFDLKFGLEELDIILQYSIVELAFKKGSITNEEVQIIEGVCKHGSLMNEIRVNSPFFNWPDFNTLSNNESGVILRDLGVYINKVSRDFAKFFGFYKLYVDDKEFIGKIQQGMNNIINVIYNQNVDKVGSPDRLPCLVNAVFRQLI